MRKILINLLHEINHYDIIYRTRYRLLRHHSGEKSMIHKLCTLTGIILLLSAHVALAADWKYVCSNGCDYPSLSAALVQREPKIFIKAGIYEVSSEILVDYDNVVIRGESRDQVILRQTAASDLLAVRKANYVTVQSLTLDAQTPPAGATVSPARAAFVAGDTNYVTLEGCRILGSNNIFAVYFAGKTFPPGQATLDAVARNDLDQFNVVRDNEVYSTWIGDVLSFSLQTGGQVVNNLVTGGLVAFYMNNNSICSDNIITDSVSEGIYYSMPANNNQIIRNLIQRPVKAGINIVTQTEHPVPVTARSGGLTLQHNRIVDSRYMGIIVNQLADSVISHNQIEGSDFDGLYFLRSDRLNVSSNQIRDVGQSVIRPPVPGSSWSNYQDSPIHSDLDLRDSMISQNLLMQTASGHAKFGIILVAGVGNLGNTVLNNYIYGTYTALPLRVDPVENTVGPQIILP